MNFKQGQQDINASKTNQAATQMEYGLNAQNKPMPFDPIGGPQGTSQLPGGQQAPPPGGLPKPNVTAAPGTSEYYRQMADYYNTGIAAAQSTGNLRYVGYLTGQRDYMLNEYKEAVTEESKPKTIMAHVNGQVVPVNATDYFNKHTPAPPTYADLHETPNNKALIAERKREYGTESANTQATVAGASTREGTESANVIAEQQGADRRAGMRGGAKGGVTANQVDSMLQEWKQGTQTQVGTSPTDNSPIYEHKPPTPEERGDVDNLVTAVQTAPDPAAASKAAINQYKKKYGKKADPDVIRILTLAGQTGGSQATGNPTDSGPALQPAQIWDTAKRAGASDQEATTLTAIAMAESSGRPGNINPHDPLGNGKFQHAWGLWQLGNGTNDPNAYPGWQDPATNARYALEKLRTQGWKAWGTYRSGAYRQFLP